MLNILFVVLIIANCRLEGITKEIYVFFFIVAGIFRLTSSNAELVYSNLAAMVNSSGASGPQQQAAVLFRLGQLGRQLQASGQQPFILPMPNPPAAHQTPADLSSKSSRNKSKL